MKHLSLSWVIMNLKTWWQKQFFLPLCAIMLCVCTTSTAIGQQLSSADSIQLIQYNMKAVRLMNDYRCDESRELLRKANQLMENAVTYYYMSQLMTVELKWDSAAFYAKKALSLDTGMTYAYYNLFLGYTQTGRWKDAQSIEDNIKRADPNGSMAGQLAALDLQVSAANRSSLMVTLFILVLAAVFLFGFYRPSKDTTQSLSHENKIRFSEVLLVSATVGGILYTIFFYLAPWIRSQNPPIPIHEFTYYKRPDVMDHDGVETTALYLLVVVSVLITFLAVSWLMKLKTNKTLYLSVCSVLFVVTGYHFFRIGFFPPVASLVRMYALLPYVLVALSVGLFGVYKYNSLLAKVIVVCLAIFAGLVPYGAPSTLDYMYVLYPALRYYHGFKISDIYIQYDLLLSILVYIPMKLHLSLDWGPYILSTSFFLFYIGAFFFGERFFKTKGLSVIFIVAMIIARYYIVGHSENPAPQATPFRLDLWLILLLAVFFKGVHHWSVGLSLGLIIIFHRSLGLLYGVAYCQLLLVLFVMDIVDNAKENGVSFKMIADLLKKHLRLNLVNLAIVVGSLVLCIVLFGQIIATGAGLYRKFGLGFSPVSRLSFYWYFPIVLGCLFVFLMYLRKKLGERYTTAGVFIVLLSIVNSMYFFGRSHENNILNLTGVFVLALFVLFDLLIFHAPDEALNISALTGSPAPNAAPAPQKSAQTKKAAAKIETGKVNYLSRRNIYFCLPLLFIFLTGSYYSERIYSKVTSQYDNILESNFPIPFELPVKDMDTASVRLLTHNSQKVYFMNDYFDFYYYYYGKYTPPAYFSPHTASIFQQGIIDSVQNLLDKNYYVIYSAKEYHTLANYLPHLRYNQSSQRNDVIALKQVDVPYLLPKDAGSLLHISIGDSLANPGIDYAGLDIKDDFTVEVIVKPIGTQPANAGILNNLTQFQGEALKGFVFQQNGGPGQYIFGFSNETPNVPNVAFHMDDNVWHYIVATINKQTLSVYDNGKLLGSANSGGKISANSELPLTIGNRSSRDGHFSGYIREVKISNGNLDPNEVTRRAEKLTSELNVTSPNSSLK